MKIYRIAKWEYLEDLTGTGAKIYGGRWNGEGYPMVYTSENLALAVLELLANQIRRLVDETFGFVTLSVPDNVEVQFISTDDLERDWRRSDYLTQTKVLGTQWLNSMSSLVLMVPSAVLTQENNILINPSHEDFSKLKVINKGALELDRRISIAETA